MKKCEEFFFFIIMLRSCHQDMFLVLWFESKPLSLSHSNFDFAIALVGRVC